MTRDERLPKIFATLVSVVQQVLHRRAQDCVFFRQRSHIYTRNLLVPRPYATDSATEQTTTAPPDPESK